MWEVGLIFKHGVYGLIPYMWEKYNLPGSLSVILWGSGSTFEHLLSLVYTLYFLDPVLQHQGLDPSLKNPITKSLNYYLCDNLTGGK